MGYQLKTRKKDKPQSAGLLFRDVVPVDFKLIDALTSASITDTVRQELRVFHAGQRRHEVFIREANCYIRFFEDQTNMVVGKDFEELFQRLKRIGVIKAETTAWWMGLDIDRNLVVWFVVGERA